MSWYKKAQSFGELLEDDDPDVFQEAWDDVFTPFSQGSTSSCTTTYEISGVKVLLWIIVGGTPALSFEDHSFIERFPKVESWSNDFWDIDEEKYEHQTKENVQGPTVDVLPDGADTLRDFIKRNLPLKQLRDERYSLLPLQGRISSRKRMLKPERHFVEYSLALLPNTFYISHIDDKCSSLFPWGSELQNFLKPILLRTQGQDGYEVFTDEEFAAFLDLIEKGKASGELKL